MKSGLAKGRSSLQPTAYLCKTKDILILYVLNTKPPKPSPGKSSVKQIKNVKKGMITEFLIQTDLCAVTRSLHDVEKNKAYRGDCRFARSNSVTAENILIKFNMNFKPLEAIPSPYFSLLQSVITVKQRCTNL
jgi:hypothetical protein